MSYIVPTYLTVSTQILLNNALGDEPTGNQIGLRLINSTPASIVAAQAVLSTLATDPFTILMIKRCLADSLAGDNRGAAGLEMAGKINGMVTVLQAYTTGRVVATAATGTLATTTPITLTSVATGTARNTTTLHLVINAAAANPTNTVLATFSGTSSAIVLTITPNDGTHNSATPVNVTSAQLVQLINTGLISGETVTLTDSSSLRILQTSTGGSTDVLTHAGDGDGDTATFAGGTNLSNPSLLSAQSAMGSSPMSAQTYLNLVDALAGDFTAAEATEIQTKYNAMITYVQAIVPA